MGLVLAMEGKFSIEDWPHMRFSHGLLLDESTRIELAVWQAVGWKDVNYDRAWPAVRYWCEMETAFANQDCPAIPEWRPA